MKKLTLPEFELEVKPDFRVLVLSENASFERSHNDFRSLRAFFRTFQKDVLLPSDKRSIKSDVLGWFERLVVYNAGLLKSDVMRRFLTERNFRLEDSTSKWQRAFSKVWGKVGDLLVSKKKFEGSGILFIMRCFGGASWVGIVMKERVNILLFGFCRIRVDWGNGCGIFI